jgi:[ribosomal protein S5]-alanine N-acetyltransferase
MPSPPPRTPFPEVDPKVELFTEDLHLRPMVESDAEEIFPWVSDPAFPRFMSWSAHRTLDETRELLGIAVARQAVRHALTFAVTRQGRIVGCVGLLDITFAVRAQRVDRAELGYWTAPPAQGQKVAQRASRAVMKWAFEELGLHRITVGVIAENEPSRKVIEALGFRFLARIPEDCYRENRWWDVLRYELLRVEWNLKETGGGTQ